MNFPPEHYFQAAIERMRQAHSLFKDEASYALAIYVGGVAVECLLRAFKGRRNPTFDERHNLPRLFLASGMVSLNAEKLKAMNWTEERIHNHERILRGAVNEIYRLWANNYRFASEDRLRSHLKKLTGYQTMKRDYLREVARRFLESAQTFIQKGAMLWHG